jgi:hypothetical protein
VGVRRAKGERGDESKGARARARARAKGYKTGIGARALLFR